MMKYELIFKMWLNGNNVKEISREVGLSEVRIRKVLKALAQEGLIEYPRKEKGESLKKFIEILKSQ